MIWEKEIDPSGKARCQDCMEFIRKGAKRFTNSYSSNFGHFKYDHYCYICGKKQIREKIKELKREIKDHKDVLNERLIK